MEKPANQLQTVPHKAIPIIFEHETVAYWLKNIPSNNTRQAYQNDLIDFIIFRKIRNITDFKQVKRSDIIDWRDFLRGSVKKPSLAIRSVKRKMATLSRFFSFLCDENILESNVVLGVERPKLQANKGATAPIGDFQTRDLLNGPDTKTLSGKRDRAILATFVYHALRRSELCQLKVKDIEEREGIKQFKIFGKGDKVRYVSVSHHAIGDIQEYLEISGHANNPESPLFLSVSNNTKNNPKHMTPIAIYNIVIKYGKKTGTIQQKFSPHSLRSTAATNAANRGVPLKKIQEWLGHANISTTALYVTDDNAPKDSPSFQVRY